MRSHLTLILLAVSLAACSGAFEPVGTGNSSDDDTDDTSSDDTSEPSIDAGPTTLTPAETFTTVVLPIMNGRNCYSCHSPGGSFPDFGNTFELITAYSGAGGKMVGCRPNNSMLSTKKAHSGSQWWDAEQQASVDAFIEAAAAENPSCAAKPSDGAYFDENLGRLIE